MKLTTYGLGKTTELTFKKLFGVNSRIKSPLLKTFLGNNFRRMYVDVLSGQKLFKNVKANIDFHKDIIKSYVGTRHRRNYPVRGQRTHTNAKNAKKKYTKKSFF